MIIKCNESWLLSSPLDNKGYKTSKFSIKFICDKCGSGLSFSSFGSDYHVSLSEDFKKAKCPICEVIKQNVKNI